MERRNKCKTSIISNLWARMISLKAGEVYGGHSHNFDHTHLLAVGKVVVCVEGVETEFEAPTTIFIAKDKVHAMKAVTDSVGYCIHPIRDGYRVEDIVHPDMVPGSKDRNPLIHKEGEESPMKDTESKPWEDDDI